MREKQAWKYTDLGKGRDKGIDNCGGGLFILCLFLLFASALIQPVVATNFTLVGSTANVDNVSVYNSTLGIVSHDSGAATFQLQSDYFGNLRITDNSQVVLNYRNGTFYKVSGWDVSYDGNNINITANLMNLTGQRNYIVVDFAPQIKSVNSGYYGRVPNQAALDFFSNSSFDWYWYQSDDRCYGKCANTFSYILNLTSKNKKVLLRPWFWNNDSLIDKNWTQLDTNVTLLNTAIDSIKRQIDAIGINNVYAVVISEEEPALGFLHNGMSAPINQTSYVNASNHVYESLKSIYPSAKILQGVFIFYLSSTNLSLLSRDGIVDDWYAPLYTNTPFSLSYWYDNILKEQNIHPDTYALIWAGSNFSGSYEALTPQYTQDAFELGKSKLINNIGFFGIESIGSGFKDILFNDYNYNSSLELWKRSELYKESMFRMVSVYSSIDMYGIYKGFENSIDSNGNITYSRGVYPYDVRIQNFSVVPTSNHMNITVTTWNTTGDYLKVWNESSISDTSVTVQYTIGDFPARTRVKVLRNGALWDSYLTNSTGYITFNYITNNSYSDIQFTVLSKKNWKGKKVKRVQ